MNAQEKKWIRKKLYKILVTDLVEDLDCQADDINDFLADLAEMVGLDGSVELNYQDRKRLCWETTDV